MLLWLGSCKSHASQPEKQIVHTTVTVSLSPGLYHVAQIWTFDMGKFLQPCGVNTMHIRKYVF